tara:strand:+ start:4061 stop:4330 length:270 start_codon:yes stop_codon:yes gene_type:complete
MKASKRPKIRKVNTKRRKQIRKELNKVLAEQAAAMLNHPEECCLCATPFERNKTTVQSWHVTVKEDRALLTCPSCWEQVETLAAERMGK